MQFILVYLEPGVYYILVQYADCCCYILLVSRVYFVYINIPGYTRTWYVLRTWYTLIEYFFDLTAFFCLVGMSLDCTFTTGILRASYSSTTRAPYLGTRRYYCYIYCSTALLFRTRHEHV